jgi:hypothetical protein
MHFPNLPRVGGFIPVQTFMGIIIGSYRGW